MKLIHWNPIDPNEDLIEEDFFNLSNLKYGFDLAADVYEKNGNIIAKISLPEVDPEKIDISVENDDVLKISGKREVEKKEENKNYFYKEIKRGEFSRIIQLPTEVMASKAKAEYKDGILRIEIPKKNSKSSSEKIKAKRK
ncbi:Hsp20 family protein [Candidatus Dependentiae bacterium]|nr:Hsp20 family protein [Candidatus Dependentiae bacterium]